MLNMLAALKPRSKGVEFQKKRFRFEWEIYGYKIDKSSNVGWTGRISTPRSKLCFGSLRWYS